MNHYDVQFTPAASRQFRKLASIERKRIASEIDRLQIVPRPPGVEKLAGADNLWRVRVGDYRIVYEVHDKVLVVVIIKIGHRREVYK